METKAAAEILSVANNVSEAFRSTITDEDRAVLDTRRGADEPELTVSAASPEDAMIEFAADALQALADDMSAVIDDRRKRLYRQALEVYYAAESLARDPEHAHLREQVETMRRAHEREYGYPPPPRV